MFLDGEGLGHTPNSSSSIPSATTKQFDESDVILLVDNATQPMQAAAIAALRTVITTGSIDKLLVAFTHFDEVKGDNLRSYSQKEEHILASVEGALSYIGGVLTSGSEGALRRRLDAGTWFLGRIQDVLEPTSPARRHTITSLKKLLDSIRTITEPEPEPTIAVPVYDRLNIGLAVTEAANVFHEDWRARLGLGNSPRVTKSHWASIKALNRRLAEGWDDEFGNLMPVADIWMQPREQIFIVIQNPIEWRGVSPSADDIDPILNKFANQVSTRVAAMCRSRVISDQVQKWQDGYRLGDPGSTFERAHLIADDIYFSAIPVPSVTPSLDRNKLMNEVVELVKEASRVCGAELL